jgi:hypothetical protein
MGNRMYPDSTPVPDPVSPEKKKPTAKVPPKPAPKPMPKPSKVVQYPDSVPVPDPVTYARGGSVSSRADGCATKGKTRGKIV